MTRLDLTDPHTAGALELLGQVLAEARRLGLEALIEPLSWKGGAVDRTTDAVIYAAVVAHDLGAPLIKVPVPADVAPGPARVHPPPPAGRSGRSGRVGPNCSGRWPTPWPVARPAWPSAVRSTSNPTRRPWPRR